MRPDKLDQPEYLSKADKATQELYRKFQAILNKLTPQKFQSLAEQALELQIDTEERLRGVIDKIFTKVCLGGLGLSAIKKVGGALGPAYNQSKLYG